MKHSQQMIDAIVRIRATGAPHLQIAQHLGISKNTSSKWSHLHADAIEETIKDNREDARFYENFQRAEELLNVNNSPSLKSSGFCLPLQKEVDRLQDREIKRTDALHSYINKFRPEDNSPEEPTETTSGENGEVLVKF